MCCQDAATRKRNRKDHDMHKEMLLLETKKQVQQYKLLITEQLEQKNNEMLHKKKEILRKRAAKRQAGQIEYEDEDLFELHSADDAEYHPE